MFTGIVDHCGHITSIQKTPKGLRFTVDTQFHDFELGESIMVDGVCLTVTDIHAHTFCCDVSPETLALTIMSHYRVGDSVNLERALALGDRMGGHYVTGHVDRTLSVLSLKQHDDYLEIRLGGIDQQQAGYIVPKGSVTLNGVSLTVNEVNYSEVPYFSVMLIPHTLSITNLNQLREHSLVNVEFDYYAKVIAHQFALYSHQEVAHVT